MPKWTLKVLFSLCVLKFKCFDEFNPKKSPQEYIRQNLNVNYIKISARERPYWQTNVSENFTFLFKFFPIIDAMVSLKLLN